MATDFLDLHAGAVKNANDFPTSLVDQAIDNRPQMGYTNRTSYSKNKAADGSDGSDGQIQTKNAQDQTHLTRSDNQTSLYDQAMAQPYTTGTKEKAGCRNSMGEGTKSEEDRPTALQDQIARYGQFTAANSHSTGHAGLAIWNALKAANIEAPLRNPAEINSITGMHRLENKAKLQPGDVVLIGKTAAMPSGNAFIVTPDGKAASDHITNIPDFSNFYDVRIFRSDK